MRFWARHYATGEPLEITCSAGRIQSVERDPQSSILDPRSALPWVAPSLFDLQINGCDGISFNSDSLTPDGIRHVIGTCRQHGIGGLCPTLITNSFAALVHG